MQRTRVKICGVTRVQDALSAAEHGADAVGMIFHPDSARNIDPDIAAEIVASLPPFVTPVGVFVNPDSANIYELTSALGITTVQLNTIGGKYIFDELEDMRVIQAIHLSDQADEQLDTLRDTLAESAANVVGLVVDTAVPGQPGGTGIANDWDLLERLIHQGAFKGLPPLIAAGGLTPDNVAEVVTRFHPFAVDVSSGVEESRGIKSPTLIERFCYAARSV